MQHYKNITLTLENGAVFKGKSFGYEKAVSGNIVFNTAMVGYPEILSDPAYCGKILLITYPHIGNYGVPKEEKDTFGISKNFESETITVKALIVSDYSFEYSHWNAEKTLSQWLIENEVVGIMGLDTRLLAQTIRDNGIQNAQIEFEEAPAETSANKSAKTLADVSAKSIIKYGACDGSKKIVAVMDFGVKNSNLRALLERGVDVVRVPYTQSLNNIKYDALFISNGPEDCICTKEAVETIKSVIESGKPIYALGMGCSVMAQAIGAKLTMLHHGHFTTNQPIRMEGTNRCFITEQAHRYAIDAATLPADWKVTFTNLNDGTVEGFAHNTKPLFCTTFYPETTTGISDTGFIYDNFIKLL